ncbi:MAG: hypothetical protein Q8R05_01810 [Candidatus Omnitrophota bacterium]|nr:hypothetical protein [Candidatus Omnitrophota bacterium]
MILSLRIFGKTKNIVAEENSFLARPRLRLTGNMPITMKNLPHIKVRRVSKGSVLRNISAGRGVLYEYRNR